MFVRVKHMGLLGVTLECRVYSGFRVSRTGKSDRLIVIRHETDGLRALWLFCLEATLFEAGLNYMSEMGGSGWICFLYWLCCA